MLHATQLIGHAARLLYFMYRLNVKVSAYGRQTVPDRGVVRSCDPLKFLGAPTHVTETAEPKVVKFCKQVGTG